MNLRPVGMKRDVGGRVKGKHYTGIGTKKNNIRLHEPPTIKRSLGENIF